MASIQEQSSWLLDSVGVLASAERVLRVTGDDAESWLNGQVTADVRNLTPGAAVYALAVSLKGRVLSDLWVVRDAQGLALVLPAAGYDAARAQFERHIIMEDVELMPQSELRVLSLQGPRAAQLLGGLHPDTPRFACARLPQPGFDVWLPEADLQGALDTLGQAARALGGGVVEEAGYAQACVLLAVPRLGSDFGPDSYPQEAGLKARAVSFNKGCYVGQEVVYMLENRGQLPRRLVQLEGPTQGGPAAAESVMSTLGPAHVELLDAEGKRVGELTSLAEPQPQDAPTRLALGYVKRGAAEVGARVQARGREWRVRCVVGLTDARCPIVAST